MSSSIHFNTWTEKIRQSPQKSGYRTVPLPPKCPFCYPFILKTPFFPPGNHWFIFSYYNFVFSRMSFKWTHTLYKLLRQISSIFCMIFIFKLHPSFCVYQSFLFIPLSARTTISLSLYLINNICVIPVFDAYERVAISLCVQDVQLTLVFISLWYIPRNELLGHTVSVFLT